MMKFLLFIFTLCLIIEPGYSRPNFFESLNVKQLKDYYPNPQSQEPLDHDLQYGKTKSKVRIGAFNIQSFGRHKMTQKETLENILSILTRYDLVLIQEIRDKSEVAIFQLLELLKEHTGRNLRIALSKRLGDGRHKEQLAYIYDSDLFAINFTSSPIDEDDVFYREPYIAKVTHKKSNVTFIALGAHLSPKFVIKELEGIYDIAREIIKDWNKEKLIIMGDLNASCDYITKFDLANNSLRHPDFSWLIEDSADTTIHDTTCAYDRIITSEQMNTHIRSKASTFKFEKILRLTRTESLKISDHYPVELILHL